MGRGGRRRGRGAKRAPGTVRAEALQQWVRERLRSSRVPERVLFRSELPYNEMGKVLRRVVRAGAAGAQA